MSYLTQKLWKNNSQMPPLRLPGMTPHIETKHTVNGVPHMGFAVLAKHLPDRSDYLAALWKDDPFWVPPGTAVPGVMFSTDWSRESFTMDIPQ